MLYRLNIPMLKKHNQLFLSLMMAADFAVVVLAWVGAYHLRFTVEVAPVLKGDPGIGPYLRFLPVVAAVWMIALWMGGVYQPMRADSRFHEYWRILRAGVIGTVMVMAAAFTYREHEYSRLFMGLFWLCGTVGVTASHIVVRTMLREMRRRGHNLRYILIVGAGDLARRLVENFSRHPESGMVVVGMLGDAEEEAGSEYLGVKVIGAVEGLKEMIRRHGVDQIFIALPRHAHDRLEKTLRMLDDEMVDVKLAPDIMEFMRLNPSVEDFDGIPIVSLTESPLYGWNSLLKRVFDIIGSMALITLTAPVMAAVALAIRRESRGPVIFRQERMSLGGEPFTIYKFRSMRVDAEVHTGAVWATQNDPRRTRVGEFIRATSLDELPQFFNVLEGSMSLVGPRPERPVFVEGFKNGIPRYMLRHKVKAGITGWAQVNGWRGDTSLEKRIEFDLYYIENWSLLFDLKILWLTLWRGFINKNAY